jgi:hypothetical protein
MFFLPPSHAADSEPELFVKGYEYILSLDAHNAAQTFRTFLQEFPHSSARDAALFWLGRALISLKSYAEADQLLRSIPREFPASPYLPFVDMLRDEIVKSRVSSPAKGSDVVPPPAIDVPLKQDVKPHEYDKEMSQALEERNRVTALLEEEQRARGSLQIRLSELEAKEGLMNKQIAETESALQKLSAGEIALHAEKREKERLSSEAEILQAENTVLQARIQDAERRAEQGITGMNILNSYLAQCMAQTDDLAPAFAAVPSPELEKLWSELTDEKRTETTTLVTAETETGESDVKQPEPAVEHRANAETPQPPQETGLVPAPSEPSAGAPIVIKGKIYPRDEVNSAVAASERVLSKLGMKEPAWRSGAPLEDFIDEHLLLEAAESSGVRIDEKKYLDTADRLQLSAEEAAYLRTFMMIGSFVGRHHMNSAPDLFIETLTGHYTNRDALAYANIAVDLQNAARAGKSFEEIGQQYRNFVKLSRLSIDDFKSLYKDKSHIIDKLNFQSGETAVVWSEEGFMLIMPVAAYKLFDPFVDPGTEERERIKTLLSGYVADLKKNWQPK